MYKKQIKIYVNGETVMTDKPMNWFRCLSWHEATESFWKSVSHSFGITCQTTEYLGWMWNTFHASCCSQFEWMKNLHTLVTDYLASCIDSHSFKRPSCKNSGWLLHLKPSIEYSMLGCKLRNWIQTHSIKFIKSEMCKLTLKFVVVQGTMTQHETAARKAKLLLLSSQSRYEL